LDVLFLAHRAPYPPDKGDRLRAWRHLQRLATFGPVDLVAQADSEADAAAALPGLRSVCREVHVFVRRKPAALLAVGTALLAGGSLTLGWHRDRRVDVALDGLCARHDYGLLWAFSSGTAAWIGRCRPHARASIMDLCDLDALKWEALGATTGGARGFIDRTEAKRLLPVELRLAADADLTLLITPAERDDLLARGGRPRRVEVLTNGVPWRELSGLPAPSAAGPVLGFLGQMDYPPNVEAATFLAQQVLPAVRAAVPGARLLIMGRAPTAEVRALAAGSGGANSAVTNAASANAGATDTGAAVEVTGALDSVAAGLARCAVFLSPLRSGRGLPNKILEALAAGRATVVSPFCARALSGTPGRDYLVADGADAMAAAAIALLRDDRACDALGAAGAAWVRTAHDWDDVLARLADLARETAHA
jgi:polysaccharide biosynthesis protein PslH